MGVGTKRTGQVSPHIPPAFAVLTNGSGAWTFCPKKAQGSPGAQLELFWVPKSWFFFGLQLTSVHLDDETTHLASSRPDTVAMRYIHSEETIEVPENGMWLIDVLHVANRMPRGNRCDLQNRCIHRPPTTIKKSKRSEFGNTTATPTCWRNPIWRDGGQFLGIINDIQKEGLLADGCSICSQGLHQVQTRHGRGPPW